MTLAVTKRACKGGVSRGGTSPAGRRPWHCPAGAGCRRRFLLCRSFSSARRKDIMVVSDIFLDSFLVQIRLGKKSTAACQWSVNADRNGALVPSTLTTIKVRGWKHQNIIVINTIPISGKSLSFCIESFAASVSLEQNSMRAESNVLEWSFQNFRSISSDWFIPAFCLLSNWK